ncbi:AI-2E family transporter [Methanobacterium petrolearium]|uniref:AI-2E family transporter n=1 Tax=Methanobacterium petrolearium TaxID=710190 RepID=UPI001FD79342|nr:AI-2E family transporter [Methanobacterium petrolearium]MBP1946742.1 putative PurR-regulated permease PerM [Methanobacterium petrolearium]BDZ70988.1 AI-2E family transporter [Methanobacterium petrolearium]
MEDLRIPPFLQQIIVIAVIFLVIIGMKYSSEILGPILLTVFISIIIYPFLKWLEKRGLSYNQSIVVTLVATFALGLSIIWFLAVSLVELIKQLPSLTITSGGILAQYGNDIIKFLVSNIPLGNISGFIATGIFMLFAIIFLVYELPQIKIRLTKGLGADNPNLRKIFDIIDANIKYFIIRAKVNLIYGIGVSAILFVFDINFAVLWGLLTFALGFIPYLGIMLAAIPPVLVAWAKYGIWGAISMGLFFIVINTIAESYIFPKLTGKGLQMSVFVVFVSLFVWGWIIGPTGFLIGVPLTLIVINYLENFHETRWLASLMISKEEDEEEKDSKADQT